MPATDSDSYGSQHGDNATMPRTSRTILVLAGLHVIAGVATAVTARSFWPVTPFHIWTIGLFFAQQGLVGILAGVARLPLFGRFIIVSLGCTYSIAFITIVVGDLDPELIPLVLVSIGSVAVILSVAERRYITMASVPTQRSGTRAGLQFQIKHILLFMLAVAITVSMGKWLELTVTADALLLAIIYGTFAAMNALACVWSCLGIAHPIWRCVLVAVISAGGGLAMGSVPSGGPPLFWLGVAVVATSIEATTLLVLRQTGCRMMGKSRASLSEPPVKMKPS